MSQLSNFLSCGRGWIATINKRGSFHLSISSRGNFWPPTWAFDKSAFSFRAPIHPQRSYMMLGIMYLSTSLPVNITSSQTWHRHPPKSARDPVFVVDESHGFNIYASFSEYLSSLCGPCPEMLSRYFTRGLPRRLWLDLAKAGVEGHSYFPLHCHCSGQIKSAQLPFTTCLTSQRPHS